MSAVSVVQPDLTILLDLEGVIQKATLSTSMSSEALVGWVGRAWFDTVGEVAGDRVRSIVEDARRSGVSAFRQVTQRFPSGLELPMEFTTVRLGGKSGLLAIGRNLQAVGELQTRLIAAQHAREQDYWKLREVETRYRLLFDATHEAVLVLTVEGLRVVEANPAAIRALGFSPGWDFLPEIAPADVDAFRAMLARVREQGRAPGMLVHIGATRAPWVARASLIVAEPGSVFLLQVAPAASAQIGAPTQALSTARQEPVALETLLDRLPDAFVAVEPGGVIRRANGAFLDLVQIGAEGAALGENLGRWLTLPGADAGALLANVQRHRIVRMFASRIFGELGSEAEVEISAAGSTDQRPRLVGVLLRDVGRRDRNPAATLDAGGLGAALATVAEQVGKTSLLQLVKETTAVVERHYIDAALELAGGNRTAAAELLGLSRQSLYVKLGRYAVPSPAQADASQGD